MEKNKSRISSKPAKTKVILTVYTDSIKDSIEYWTKYKKAKCILNIKELGIIEFNNKLNNSNVVLKFMNWPEENETIWDSTVENINK